MSKIVLKIEDYNGSYFKKDENYLDYIEIGSNDWDVLSMTHTNLKGIIIEPIKKYLDNVPENKNVIKVNCAISDENNAEGYMHYIPENIINEKNIVNCFKGMNKLNDFHIGHIGNNLTDYVVKEKCEVMTYFTLINKYKIDYVDLLKIDTEGNDCKIINNILDELDMNPSYILPRYIYFENNGLTPLEIRVETIYRLHQHGYVHIYTENDNTFMYNCKTHYLKILKKNNIKLPFNNNLQNKNSINFFQDVHSYITYGQVDLFENILKLNTTVDSSKANIIWTTQEVLDYEKYNSNANANENTNIVNIIHGGGFIYSKLLDKPNLNIMVKSIDDYIYLNKNNINCNNISLFIGKYKSQEKMAINIFDYRQNNFKKLNNKFLMLNGFFKMNNLSVQNTYENLKKKYEIDLYGFDSELGLTDVLNNSSENNVLAKYKFMLHLKGNGYLCNSVICAFMVGMPVIMSRDVYIQTLYYQFIPQELIILIDNDDIQKINENEVKPQLDFALNMSDEEYMTLSKKTYIQGTYFREYYKDEINHLNYFMNNLC
jgi:hypothetical protein